MQSTYIAAGFTEIHRLPQPSQVESAELVVEDADNSDNPGEREIVALVTKDRETGDDLATVQLTEKGAYELYEALGNLLGKAVS